MKLKNSDDSPKTLTFREIAQDEPLPVNLLLLADESVKAINVYIGKCRIFLMETSNTSIGVCAVHEIDNSTIEIKNIAILETYRNQGIGSWCLQKIKETFHGKDILVGTGDGSLSALNFYQKNGFVKDFVRENFFTDNYDDKIIENGMVLKHQIVLRKSLKA
ncbi:MULTISPECIES: GNAT family N-acetyltransferase [Flavobacteriaceae]|uniref:GNAT family N-acetyltransferase n=1 Tax=Flavobacteriaceae TaxID=49546 RepID=UPI0014926596|nr:MULTISPECIES: GNAT family N-acetyltransferase [Allomuricauda]MDC6367515.1 GNAT family N-acetyltransferase [Muricauda sp. AC10]